MALRLGALGKEKRRDATVIMQEVWKAWSEDVVGLQPETNKSKQYFRAKIHCNLFYTMGVKERQR